MTPALGSRPPVTGSCAVSPWTVCRLASPYSSMTRRLICQRPSGRRRGVDPSLLPRRFAAMERVGLCLAEVPPDGVQALSWEVIRVEVLFERVAGLDIGKESLCVCVRTPGPRGRRVSRTRPFATTTRSLEVTRDWLLAQSVTIAAMESTSTYWKAPFCCLEEVLEVWLLNAAHIKAVLGLAAGMITALIGLDAGAVDRRRHHRCAGPRAGRRGRLPLIQPTAPDRQPGRRRPGIADDRAILTTEPAAPPCTRPKVLT